MLVGLRGDCNDEAWGQLWKFSVMGWRRCDGVVAWSGVASWYGVACRGIVVRRGQAARKGETFDEEADAKLVAQVEAGHEAGSIALEASGAISDDGIIDPRDTRTVLGICLSVVGNRAIEGAEAYGVFRL